VKKAGPEPETEAISEVQQQAEGFASQAPIEEAEENNPPTMGETAIDTQVITLILTHKISLYLKVSIEIVATTSEGRGTTHIYM